MELSSIALQGLRLDEAQLETAAANLTAPAAAYAPGIASQLLALNSASTSAELNIETLKTADQLQKTVLNLFA